MTNVNFISTAGLFNFPSKNALERFQSNDLSGVHLNKGGKGDLVAVIMGSVEQHRQTTPCKKRPRSMTETPPSDEKEAKSGRHDPRYT